MALQTMTVADTLAIRTGAAYQAADRTRRRLGAAHMASQPQTSEEYAAIRLLIGVWESLSAAAMNDIIDRNLFFSTNPIGLAFQGLSDAIRLIRQQTGDQTFASNFEAAANAFSEWTSTKEGERFKSLASQQAMTVFSSL